MHVRRWHFPPEKLVTLLSTRAKAKILVCVLHRAEKREKFETRALEIEVVSQWQILDPLVVYQVPAMLQAHVTTQGL